MSSWNDCPRCPSCTMPCGSRIGPWTSIARARDNGAGYLACTACGHVWHATPEELAQADSADRAWMLRQQEANQ